LTRCIKLFSKICSKTHLNLHFVSGEISFQCTGKINFRPQLKNIPALPSTLTTAV
jgi:hypothetical protein